MKSSYSLVERNFKIKVVLILCLLFSIGCATKDAVKNLSDEDVLKERVMAYWNHKVKREFDKSYEYEDPYYKKKSNMVSYIQGIKVGRAAWTGAEIKSLKIDGDSAIVDMMVRVSVIISSEHNFETSALLKERWLKVDGLWYHSPQKFMEKGTVN